MDELVDVEVESGAQHQTERSGSATRKGVEEVRHLTPPRSVLDSHILLRTGQDYQ
jgi:hypothetical protein